ncbi:hypothetical protein GCM10010521_41580 [Streptomyces rameus]|uniref:Uncharacterized protein n=1 Tax=Streptomyces rameus TaxID=68261 RepID=A0ABP6NIK7_9ACTN
MKILPARSNDSVKGAWPPAPDRTEPPSAPLDSDDLKGICHACNDKFLTEARKYRMERGTALRRLTASGAVPLSADGPQAGGLVLKRFPRGPRE